LYGSPRVVRQRIRRVPARAPRGRDHRRAPARRAGRGLDRQGAGSHLARRHHGVRIAGHRGGGSGIGARDPSLRTRIRKGHGARVGRAARTLRRESSMSTKRVLWASAVLALALAVAAARATDNAKNTGEAGVRAAEQARADALLQADTTTLARLVAD